MIKKTKPCQYCCDIYARKPFLEADNFVERSLDDYAFVGVNVYLDKKNQISVFATTDKNKTFASQEGSFKANYCPICGRDLRDANIN